MPGYRRDVGSNMYRNLVSGVNTRVPLENGAYVNSVNFDNAATTPPFVAVEREIHDFLPWYSSIHRGRGYKSVLSTEVYESGRNVIKGFVNADSNKDVVIYTKNTTDAINMLACNLSQQKDKKDTVISTWMEHAANDLPWRDKFNVEYVETDQYGRLIPEDLENKLKKNRGRVKLVTVTGAANVTGYLNDIHELARMAHKYDAPVHIDGAQYVPHVPMDMKPFGSAEHIDFLSFSAHKMYAPFGSGVLIGPKAFFECGEPYCKGGSAIQLVTHNNIIWEEPPAKSEAGTPNLIGVVALVAAVNELSRIGMHNAYSHEKSLLNYIYPKISNIPGITLYSHPELQKSIGVVAFNMEGVHHSLMSAILSYEAGIAVRNGFFCAHPYCERLLGYSAEEIEAIAREHRLFPGIVRASFGLYNNYSEIDGFIDFLQHLAANKKFYIDKYGNSRGMYNIRNEV